MDKQEIARELGQSGARELLESATLARLAYNGLDGLPRVIPIAFYWTGECVVVCTATTSPKVRALSARPDVAITIDTGDTPAAARSLLVRGVASVETVDGVAEEYLEAAKKAMDPDSHAAFEGAVRSMYKQQVRVAIEPRWARFYDFGAGRVPAFLAKLAASTRELAPGQLNAGPMTSSGVPVIAVLRSDSGVNSGRPATLSNFRRGLA